MSKWIDIHECDTVTSEKRGLMGTSIYERTRYIYNFYFRTSATLDQFFNASNFAFSSIKYENDNYALANTLGEAFNFFSSLIDSTGGVPIMAIGVVLNGGATYNLSGLNFLKSSSGIYISGSMMISNSQQRRITILLPPTGNATLFAKGNATSVLTTQSNTNMNMLENDVIEHNGGGGKTLLPIGQFARARHEERRAA